MLLVAMHVCEGQPARGPGMLSLCWYNTDRGGLRNVILEDNTVVFVTRYHKRANITNDTNIVHRYLPRELGCLVIWYLWLVRPFADAMYSMYDKLAGRPNPPHRAAFLCPNDHHGKGWRRGRLRKLLRAQSKAHLAGQELNLQAYRYIAIAISRQCLSARPQFVSNRHLERSLRDLDNMTGMVPSALAAYTADL